MMQSNPLGTRVDVGSPLALWTLAALLSIASAWALVFHPSLAFAAPAVLVGLAVIADPRVRFLVVVGGGVLVFQRSDELTSQKLAYLAVVAVAFGAATFRVMRLEHTSGFRIARPLLLSSFAFLAIIALSLGVAIAYGNPTKAWLRDIAPYALFATAPVLAVDAQAAFLPRSLRRILVAAGSIGVVSYVVEWMSRREVVELPISFVGLPSFLLGAALVAFAMAAALAGSKVSVTWLVVTAVVLAILPLTGSRTTVIVLAAPLAIVLGARQGLLRRSLRLTSVAPVVTVLAALALVFVVQASGADTDALTDRLEVLTRAGEGDDQSYQERMTQLHLSWQTFVSSPITGVGPGTSFDWQRSGDPWLVLDTPVSFLAKFGVIGVAAVLLVAFGYVRFLRNVRRAGGLSLSYLALLGYLAVVMGYAVLYVPFEDKGSGLALAILVALALAEARQRAAVAAR